MKNLSTDMRVTHALARKEYDKALELLQQMERIGPPTAESGFLIACIHRWKGDDTASLKTALEVIESFSRHFPTLRLLTELSFKNGQYEESRTYARRALKCHREDETTVLPAPFFWILRMFSILPLPRHMREEILELQEHLEGEKRWLAWAKKLVDSE